MNARLLSQRYPTYLLHETAMNTVARCAGMRLEDVAQELDSRMRKRQQRVYEDVRRAQSPLYRTHRRALETIARYAGLDMETVLSGFAQQGRHHPETVAPTSKQVA